MEYKKQCLSCGKEFIKPYHCSVKVFKEKRKFCSQQCKKGKFNHRWVGDKIQKDSIHGWIARKLGSPSKCELCGTTDSKKFSWSNKDHTYKRDFADWQRLCSKCHTAYDIKHNGFVPYGNKWMMPQD